MSRCGLSPSSNCGFYRTLRFSYVGGAGRILRKVICLCLDLPCICLNTTCQVKKLLKHLWHVWSSLSKGIWDCKSYYKYCYQCQAYILQFLLVLLFFCCHLFHVFHVYRHYYHYHYFCNPVVVGDDDIRGCPQPHRSHWRPRRCCYY